MHTWQKPVNSKTALFVSSQGIPEAYDDEMGAGAWCCMLLAGFILCLERSDSAVIILVNLDQTKKKSDCDSREETASLFVGPRHLANASLES